MASHSHERLGLSWPLSNPPNLGVASIRVSMQLMGFRWMGRRSLGLHDVFFMMSLESSWISEPSRAGDGFNNFLYV